MPGSFFTFACVCGARHDIHTGADSAKGQAWAYEQLVCPRCRTLQSRADPDIYHQHPPGCDRCGGQLEPWTGEVSFDRTREGQVGAEHVDGPCPRCGARMTIQGNAETIGLWD